MGLGSNDGLTVVAFIGPFVFLSRRGSVFAHLLYVTIIFIRILRILRLGFETGLTYPDVVFYQLTIINTQFLF